MFCGLRMKKKLKVVLVMVTSVNGKSTKGKMQSPNEWASKEDQEYFRALIEKHSLIVMGRRTYQAAKPVMKLVPGKRRIVITRSPGEFQKDAVGGQLEFTNESPRVLIQRAEELRYKTMLLVGGSSINSLFFKEKLIDELWLTLEPTIFSDGKGLVGGEDSSISLQLKIVKKLNTKGTLLLKYQVIL